MPLTAWVIRLHLLSTWDVLDTVHLVGWETGKSPLCKGLIWEKMPALSQLSGHPFKKLIQG